MTFQSEELEKHNLACLAIKHLGSVRQKLIPPFVIHSLTDSALVAQLAQADSTLHAFSTIASFSLPVHFRFVLIADPSIFSLNIALS